MGYIKLRDEAPIPQSYKSVYFGLLKTITAIVTTRRLFLE